MSCLWMGNVDPYMDENFVSRAFATMGELVVSVRIVRNKADRYAAGYCFVELPDEATAERCLRKVNGKPLPRSMPVAHMHPLCILLKPRRFKLKTAASGKQSDIRNVSGYFDFNCSQPYTFDHNQYYQQFSNYYSNWGYDQSADHSSYNCYNQAYEDTSEDDGLEDPNLGLDVVEANRQFMMDSEELYDALIDCHWPALEFPASSEYRSEYL
ncbi:tRNA selenocysteine 1-associated protein 1-like isoform 4-T4 [Clarias gariepinus]|uniref:tRNA selenocysteine 1-associated protein 1-like isoform X2 n=1 Tax=Clarias gariepinus TaxID=13013 RepID=UPI00234DBE77|nr:tRNA selenocysteine 1-associated protein 1-like isoform X2 [Clarias gariepinus]